MAEPDRAIIKGNKLERAAWILEDYVEMLETCLDGEELERVQENIADARELAAIFRDAQRHKVVLSG